MKNLLAPAILATDVNGKSRIFEVLSSSIFWEEGERISIEKALEKLRSKNPTVVFKQLSLIENFEYNVKNEIFITPHTFNNDDEKFNFWLRVLLDYDFSNVDEKTYKTWYENLNNGIETSYL
jgi:hypothetical protein